MGLFGWMPCCDGPEFNIELTETQQRIAQERMPCEKFCGFCQWCWIKGSILQTNSNSYWFGNINKCCEYESQTTKDIWDSGKQLRLGRIIYIKRMRQVGCCWFCCGIPDYWIKLEFPDRATPQERALMIANIAINSCLLYTSPSPRDRQKSRMPSSA
eukprot:TRINITY_DN12954_c0_g1_i1.p3 TRINITY_DN12954_c0_g1~~TRINITY_DN12954_c0_g1_i1.p3  ORF type:complete len:157 (-),score=18.41 TRINITY_DN12954_c0_g1_i1:35-505(-)